MKNKKIILLPLTIAFTIMLMSGVVLKLKEAYLEFQKYERFEYTPATTVVLKLHEIIWEEEGEEAIVNGRMFDVAHYQYTENSIILNGWYDDDESELKELQVYHNKELKDKKKQKSSFPIFSFFYVESTPNFCLHNNYATTAYNSLNESVPHQHLPIALPPPESNS